VYVSAGTRNELSVKASESLSERMLPCALAAQLAQGTADSDRAEALATVSAPCCVPVDESTQLIANALGAIVLVAPELLIAAPVTVRLVTVLREERTLPVMAAELVQGAVSDSVLETSQVTVPLETVIVARTGAVMLAVIVPVVAACAAFGTTIAAMMAAEATVVMKRLNIGVSYKVWQMVFGDALLAHHLLTQYRRLFVLKKLCVRNLMTVTIPLTCCSLVAIFVLNASYIIG